MIAQITIKMIDTVSVYVEVNNKHEIEELKEELSELRLNTSEIYRRSEISQEYEVKQIKTKETESEYTLPEFIRRFFLLDV